jgi:hypothetical protein
MAFCAITDNNIKSLEAVVDNFVSNDLESLSDFKNLSKKLYNFFLERKATPEKAVTLISMVPKTLEKWRDHKSEIGDPIEKKYRDFINDILKVSKSDFTNYNSLLKFLDIAPQVQKETKKLKSGVQEVFDSNPELASVGTPQQYSQYLDTIFPDSKVKDIVYHVNKTGIISPIDNKAFYSTDFGSWLTELEEMKGRRNPILLNITNPTIVDEKYEFSDQAKKFRESGLGDEFVTPDEVREQNTDSVIGRDSGQGGNEKTYITYKADQVYQLGSKQDIEGFKKFVTGNKVDIVPVLDNQDATLKEIDNFISSIKPEIVEVKTNDGKFLKKRSIGGVLYDTRVTDISVIGYYDTSEEQDENTAPSLKHGNTIDQIAKEVFSGKDIQLTDIQNAEKAISQEAFDSVKEYLIAIRNDYVSRGFKFRTGVTVFDPATKISGEIDLLLVDTQGNIKVADIKTMLGKYTSAALKRNRAFIGLKEILTLSKENNYSTQMYLYSLLLDKMFPGKVDTKEFLVIGIGLSYDTDLVADDSVINRIPNSEIFPVKEVRQEFLGKNLDQIKNEFDKMSTPGFVMPIKDVTMDSKPGAFSTKSIINNLYENVIISQLYGEDYAYGSDPVSIFYKGKAVFTEEDIFRYRVENRSTNPVKSLIKNHIENRKKSELEILEKNHKSKIQGLRLKRAEKQEVDTEIEKFENRKVEINEKYDKEKNDIENIVDKKLIPKPRTGRQSLDRIKLVGELAATSEEIKIEVDWLNNTFGDKIVLNLYDAINSDLNGQVYGNLVRLWKNASVGTGYHEGWHVFSQLFLTYDEKVELYESVRDSGKQISIRGGQLKNASDASYLEIEEFLAEEFAKYGLSPSTYNFEKVFGKKKQQSPKGFFQKLWSLLKRLFTKSKEVGVEEYSPTIAERYFTDLRIGNLSQYKYDLRNRMFTGALNSVTESYTKEEEIIPADRMPLYAESIDSLIRQQLKSAGRAFTSFNSDRNLRRKVFQNIYIDLYDRLEQGTDLNLRQKIELSNVLRNWAEFLEKYKFYSNYSSMKSFSIEDDAAKERIDFDAAQAVDDQSIDDLGFDYNVEENVQDEEVSKLEKQYGDKAANEESPLSKAEKSVQDYLVSIPIVKTYNSETGEIIIKKNELGYEIGSDPYDLFYRIKKNLSGIYNLNDFVKKLNDPALHVIVPELKIISQDIEKIINNLVTNTPTSTLNKGRFIEEFSFVQSFHGSLVLPEVSNTQLSVDFTELGESSRYKTKAVRDKKVVRYEVLSRVMSDRIIRRWATKFQDPRTSLIDPITNKLVEKKYFTSEDLKDPNFDIFDPQNILYMSDEGNIHLNIFAFDKENINAFAGTNLVDIEKFFSHLSITFDSRVFNSGKNIDKMKKIRSEIIESLSDIQEVAVERLYYLFNDAYQEDFNSIKSRFKDLSRRQAISEMIKMPNNEINLILTGEGLSTRDARKKQINTSIPGFTRYPLDLLRFRDHRHDLQSETKKDRDGFGQIETLSIKNHFYNIKDLAEIQEFYGDDVSSGSFRIDDRTKYPYYNTTQLLLVSNLLNQTNVKSDISSNIHLSHIDPNLPWLRANLFYTSLFDQTGKRRQVDGDNVQIVVEDIASFQLITGRRNSETNELTREYSERQVSKLTKTEKLFLDMLTLLKSGALEVRRAETSPSIMSVRMSSYNGTSAHLPVIPTDVEGRVSTSIMSSKKISGYIQNLFISELQKMYWYKQNYADNLKKFSEELNLFQGILSQDLIQQFKDIGDQIVEKEAKLEDAFTKMITIFNENPTLKDQFDKEVNAYFTEEIKYVSGQINEMTADEKAAIFSTLGNISSVNLPSTLFVINKFILRAEFDNLIFGDMYHYSNPFKRGKNVTNHGFPYFVDKVRNEILNKFNQSSLHSISKGLIIPDRKDFSIIKSAFLSDVEMPSLYYTSGNMIDNITKVRFALGLNDLSEEQQLRDFLKEKLKAYDKIKATDGQGIIGLDFYKAFCLICKIWTPEMQNEYDRQLAIFRYRMYQKNGNEGYYKNIDGSLMTGEQLEDALKTDLDLVKHKPFAEFIPLKISYTGPLKEEGRPLTPIYDKFSVRPIIPEQAFGRRDENLMIQMIDQDLDYIKFVSGSKVYSENPIDWVKKKNGEFQLDNFSVEIDENQTHNLISGYLKHQLNTFDYSKVNIYGSQFRKIFYDPAFRISAISGNKELFDRLMKSHDTVKSLTDRLMTVQENDLFNVLGVNRIFKGINEKGEKTYTYEVEDFEKFLKVLQEEGLRQGFTINFAEYLQYDPVTKKPKSDLDFAFNRKEIQDLISGMMDKRLRRLKVNGSTLIQVSGIGWEKASSYFKKPTAQQLEEFGSNDLKYYDIIYDNKGNPISVGKMQIKIPLIGDFENLLNLDGPRGFGKIKVYHINKNGDKVIDYEESIKRLNLAMSNREWKEENMSKFTIVGYRIPTSDPSFIDNMEVVEFLPPSAGNIIIAPMEQIIKSGSDFDIDNMKMIFPSILKSGKIISEEDLEGITDQQIFQEIRRLSLTEFELRDIKRQLKEGVKLSKTDLANLSQLKSKLAVGIIGYISSLNEQVGYDIIDRALYQHFTEARPGEDPKVIDERIKRAKKKLSQTVFFDEDSLKKREGIIEIIVKYTKGTNFKDLSFEEYEREILQRNESDISVEASKVDQFYYVLKEIEKIEKERREEGKEISEYSASLDIFEKKELLKKYLTNSILKEYSSTMEELAYYELLITPASQDMVDAVANNKIASMNNYSESEKQQLLTENKGKLFDKKSTVKENYSSEKEYQVWDFIMGKRKDLGGWAIHRTFSSIFNLINFSMRNEFADSKEELKTTYTPLIPIARRSEYVKDGYIKMHGQDLDGNWISDTLSGLTNATIDLVNIPAYPYLGINLYNKKIAGYLLHQGVPLETVSYFVDQPILREVYALLERKSRESKGFSLKHAIVEVAKKYGMLNDQQFYVEASNGKRYPKYQVYEQKTVKKDSDFEDSEEQELAYFEAGASSTKIMTNIPNQMLRRPWSDLNKYLDETVEFRKEDLDEGIRFEKQEEKTTESRNKQREFQKLILAYFGSIFEEADYLSSLQFAYNTDTTKYATIQSIIRNLEKKEKVRMSDIFDPRQVEKLEKETMISPFDYTERGRDILMQLFPTIYSQENINSFSEILSSTFGKNEYIEKVSKTIDNDFVEYIYKNFGRYKGENFTNHWLPKIKNTEESGEFFALEFKAIMRDFPELKDNILFVSRLTENSYKLSYSDITPDLAESKNYTESTRIWNIYLERDAENSVTQRNRFAGEWKNLIYFSPEAFGIDRQYTADEIKRISDFFNDLVYFSLYQSGATNVGNASFSDLIPPEIWTGFINDAGTRMKNFFASKPDKTLLQSFLREFQISFKENNPKNIRWNSNTYEDGTVDKRGKKNRIPLVFDSLYFKGKDYFVLHKIQPMQNPFDFLKC